jgi:putative oxidoreductase
MRALFVVGRMLLGGYFAWNGLNHFIEERSVGPDAPGKGVAVPDAAVTASGALLLAGGVSVMTGIRPRQGLAALIAFLIPATLQNHRFWEVQDPAVRMTEIANFTKNAALIGAALMLMQLDEPWPASVDGALRADEEMYIRLGDQELRSLPA